MFSRGPSACVRSSRGLSSSTFLDNIAVGADEHHEPLLFLYPRWFRSTFRQRRKSSVASITPSAATATRSISGRRKSPEPDLFLAGRKCSYCFCPYRGSGVSSRRWFSSSTAPLVDSNINYSGGNNNVVHADNGAGGATASDSTVTESRQPFTDSKDHASTREPALGALNSERTETLGKLPEEKPLGIVEKLSARDRKKLRYRLYLNKTSRNLQPWKRRAREVHWMDLLELLEEMHEQFENIVWSKPGTKQKEIHIPEETVVFLAGMTGMRENNWDVPIHNGCRVRVLDASESEGLNRKVILSGSERVVELVANRISQAQDLQASGDPLIDIRKPPVPIVPSLDALRRRNLPIPLIRGVWDENYVYSERPVLSDPIVPSNLAMGNVREFAEYVEDVTRSKRPRFGQKYDNNKSGSHNHNEQVEKTLVALFRNDANRNLVSTGALNIALAFLCRHEFLASAREVFSIAEHLATTDTFNILLRSAARRQDLAKFRDFLNGMEKLRIQPNTHTWIAFVDCVVFPPIKKELVDRILRNGYVTSTRDHRSLLQLNVEDNLLEHLESGKSVDSFIDNMRKTRGTNWANTPLLNKMFSVIIKLKDFSALERLFDISVQQGLVVDNHTLSQILKLFRSNNAWALWYFFRFLNDTPLRLDGKTFETFFLIAFKNRSYNLCRVLWRYACMYGFVSYKMKKSVLVSLVRNEPHKKRDVISDVWSVAAGKVIVGLDLHLRDCRLPSSMLELVPTEFHDHPLAYLLSGHKKAGKERDTQLRFGSELVERDIMMGLHYRPQLHVGLMVEAAAVLDDEWKDKPRPTQWLIQNAMRVPVVKRSRPPRL